MLFKIQLNNNSNNVYIAETYKQFMAHNCITYQVSVPNDTTDRKIARIIENNAAGNRKKINTG